MKIIDAIRNNHFIESKYIAIPKRISFIKKPEMQSSLSVTFLYLGCLFWKARYFTTSYSFFAISLLPLGVRAISTCQQIARKMFGRTDNFAVLPKEMFYHICSFLNPSDLQSLQATAKIIKEDIKSYVSVYYPVVSDKLNNYDTPVQSNADLSIILSQLCERDSDDKDKPLSLESLQEILSGLKNTEQLFILNAIPDLNQRGFSFFTVKDTTPLQYWAHKGNLEFVRLLVENGAKDYCKVSGNTSAYCLSRQRSALYRAAFAGHLEVVDYLLKMGANACVQFEGLASRSFIPDFIFQLSMENEIPAKTIRCFKKILEYMNFYYPNNLRFQLQIPIEWGSNALAWIQKGSSDKESKEAIQDLLYHFGAREMNVFAKNEFKEDPITECYFGQAK